MSEQSRTNQPNTEQTPLLAVCGPTASGKTGLAIALAKALGGEVVSADSMQVYRRMNIGTAKPTLAEMDSVPHHLLDILEPGEGFSVARYVELASAAVADIAARGRLPVLCGGTGLYIDSLTRNIRFAEMEEDPALRAQLAHLAEEQGPEYVWAILRDCDPALAQTLHPNNRGRVIRGIEVFRSTGVPLSEWQRRSRLAPSPYRLCMLGLRWDREALCARIDTRVDQMLEQGLEAEARGFYEGGLSRTAAQAIGYKELFGWFAGEKTREQAVEDIKRETRRYAKRQMTWLRRDERIRWLDAGDYPHPEALLAAALRIARETRKLGGNVT